MSSSISSRVNWLWGSPPVYVQAANLSYIQAALVGGRIRQPVIHGCGRAPLSRRIAAGGGFCDVGWYGRTQVDVDAQQSQRRLTHHRVRDDRAPIGASSYK